MAGNKPQGSWRTASAISTAPLIEQTEGDGLASTRDLFTKYLQKAQYLQRLSFKSPLKPELVKAITYYLLAAESIRLLLSEEVPSVTA